MSEQNFNATDQLSFIDQMIDAMEEATSKKGPGDLNLAFLGEQNFTMRIVVDANKRLFNEFRMYNVSVPSINPDTGEEIFKKVKYRAPMAWDEDKVKPFADELNNWMLNAGYYNTFFGEIVEITYGASEYFKPGPCVLIAKNKRFLTALQSAVTALAKKTSGGRLIGKELLAKSFDASQPGYLINVVSTKGQGGACNISFVTIGDPDHKIDPEIAKQFDDITKAYCPPFGPENDKNGELIIAYYKKLIEQGNSFVEPNRQNVATPANQPVTQSTQSSTLTTPVTNQPSLPAATLDKQAADDLDAELAAAGIPF